MPTIPRASDIARVVPSGQQAVSVAGGQGAIADATQGLARQVSGAALDYQNRKNNYELEQARSTFYTGKAHLDNAFDEDPDYETIPKRYSGGLVKLAEESAASISNPRLKSSFLLEAQEKAAVGFGRITDIAKGIEIKHQRGFIEQQLEAHREAGLTGDITEAIDRTTSLINASVDAGYIDPEDAPGILKRARDDMATAKLEMMEPEERLQALQAPWANNLPADTRVRLQRQAKSQLDKDVAMANVDDYNARELSYGEALAEVANIEDEEVRRMTEQRLEVNRQQIKTAKAEEQDAAYQAYFAPVRSGDITISDIPEDEMARLEEVLSPAMLNNLYAAERSAASRENVVSDRTVLEKLNSLYNDGRGDPAEVLKYFHENSAKLSDADHRTWAGVTPADFDALEGDRVFTGKQQIANKMTEGYGYEKNVGRRNERAATYEREYERFIFDYRDQNDGRDPSGKEQREFIDQLFLKLPTKEVGRFNPFAPNQPGAEKPWLEMEPDEKVYALQYLNNQDPDSFERAREIAGPTQDPNDIYELFMILSDATDAP